MKLNKIFPLFILTAIILTAIASATVYEVNNVYDGNTGKELTDVSVIGYTCRDANCDTATRLWPATMNTGNDNTIVLSYPTELQSEYGYVVYFFKPGYFPYKVKADWYGEGRTPNDYSVKLYKMTETASAQIEYFDISDTSVKIGETITITSNILSPRINKDNIKFIPAELKNDYYSDKVKISLQINGKTIETETKTLNMLWSTEQEVKFTFTPDNEGDYTIKLITEIIDNKFLSKETKEETANVKVTKETQAQDKDAPIITITYPENGKTYNSYITELKYTATDENLKSCFYSTNNKDKIAVSCNVVIKGLDSKQGTNTWTIYAEDSYGNDAEKSVTFTIRLEDDDGNEKSTPTGYRNLNKDDTWEDEQYQNQFKNKVLVSDEDADVKTSNNKLILIITSAVIFIILIFVIIAILRR